MEGKLAGKLMLAIKTIFAGSNSCLLINYKASRQVTFAPNATLEQPHRLKDLNDVNGYMTRNERKLETQSSLEIITIRSSYMLLITPMKAKYRKGAFMNTLDRRTK